MSQRAGTGRRPSGEALDGATLLLVLALIVLAAGTVATDRTGFPATSAQLTPGESGPA
jgi:hypothetical protein